MTTFRIVPRRRSSIGPTKSQPRSANVLAIPKPMPLAPPVTTATSPASSPGANHAEAPAGRAPLRASGAETDELVCQTTNRSLLPHQTDAQLDSEGVTDPGDELHGRERAAAEREEVVVRADRRLAEDLDEEVADLPLQPGRWRRLGGRRRRRRGGGGDLRAPGPGRGGGGGFMRARRRARGPPGAGEGPDRPAP